MDNYIKHEISHEKKEILLIIATNIVGPLDDIVTFFNDVESYNGTIIIDAYLCGARKERRFVTFNKKNKSIVNSVEDKKLTSFLSKETANIFNEKKSIFNVKHLSSLETFALKKGLG